MPVPRGETPGAGCPPEGPGSRNPARGKGGIVTMAVHVLEQAYQSASERVAIKNWLGKTVAIRLDSVSTDSEGRATAVMGTVFTPADTETGEAVKIDSVRIIGQLSNFETGDTVIVSVVPHGQRGQILAPPAEKDKDAEALQKAFAEQDS